MLTKSDCERTIDELDDSNKFEFYYHLASNLTLNRFLANSNNEFFFHPKQENIYKFPGFIKYVNASFHSSKFNYFLRRLMELPIVMVLCVKYFLMVVSFDRT